MRIYVASLSDYNAGRWHGCWIDCDGKSADELQAEVNAMLAASSEPHAEEWAIHDFESPVQLSEFTPLHEVAALAEAFEDLDNSEAEAFAAFIDNGCGRDVDAFREAYQGCHASLTDYAESWADDTGLLADVPESIARYFDFEAFGRDMRLGGDIWTHEGSHGLHVFRNI